VSQVQEAASATGRHGPMRPVLARLLQCGHTIRRKENTLCGDCRRKARQAAAQWPCPRCGHQEIDPPRKCAQCGQVKWHGAPGLRAAPSRAAFLAGRPLDRPAHRPTRLAGSASHPARLPRGPLGRHLSRSLARHRSSRGSFCQRALPPIGAGGLWHVDGPLPAQIETFCSPTRQGLGTSQRGLPPVLHRLYRRCGRIRQHQGERARRQLVASRYAVNTLAGEPPGIGGTSPARWRRPGAGPTTEPA
jgi:hypothetical protein